MNKCLVTTLKAKTNNEALSKYNVLTIKTKVSDSPTLMSQGFFIGMSGNGSASVNSPSVGLYKSGISGELLPYPYTVPANGSLDSHCENKNGIIEVTGKYNIARIVVSSCGTLRIKEIYGLPGTLTRLTIRNIEEGEIDVTKLANALNLGKLDIIELPIRETTSVNLINKLSKNFIKEFKSIKTVNVEFCSLFEGGLGVDDLADSVSVIEIYFFALRAGNLSSLAKLTNLTTISFSDSKQNNGDIMDFINPWIQVGRTSGKLKTVYMKRQTGITLNGSPITFPEGSYGANGTCYINWTSDGTVTFTAS